MNIKIFSRRSICSALLAVTMMAAGHTVACADICQNYLDSANVSFDSGASDAKNRRYVRAARHFKEAGKAFQSLLDLQDCLRNDKSRAKAMEFVNVSRANYISTRRSSFVVDKMRRMKERPWDFELFLSNITREEVINSDRGRKFTLLTHAVSAGNQKAVKVLVEKGIDVNALNSDGSTPLYWARNYKRAGIAKYLMEHGARDDRAIALSAWEKGEYRKAGALIHGILKASTGKLTPSDSRLLIKAIESHYLARRSGLPEACSLLDRAKVENVLAPDMAWGAFLCKNLEKAEYYIDRALAAGAMDMGFAYSVSGHLAHCSGDPAGAMDKYAEARSRGRGVTDEFPYVRSVCPEHNRELEGIEGKLARLAQKPSQGP